LIAPENVNWNTTRDHGLHKRLTCRRTVLAVPNEFFAVPTIRIIVASATGDANVAEYVNFAIIPGVASIPVAAATLRSNVEEVLDPFTRIRFASLEARIDRIRCPLCENSMPLLRAPH
jgi:hypothetical protein